MIKNGYWGVKTGELTKVFNYTWLTLIKLKNEVHFPLILLFIMHGTAVDPSLGPAVPCTDAGVSKRPSPSLG